MAGLAHCSELPLHIPSRDDPGCDRSDSPPHTPATGPGYGSCPPDNWPSETEPISKAEAMPPNCQNNEWKGGWLAEKELFPDHQAAVILLVCVWLSLCSEPAD